MKDAGIEYLVFLSSSSIGLRDPHGVKMDGDIIAFGHAQIEIALEESGIPFAAIRPGFFASNLLKQNLDTSKTPWEAILMRDSARWDNISAVDIGRVSGAVLVSPPSASKEVILLFGPQLSTQDETWETMQKAASQEIKITYLPPDEYEQQRIKKGVPPPFAKYLVKQLETAKGDEKYLSEMYDVGVANIERYSGYKPQSFADYLASNAP